MVQSPQKSKQKKRNSGKNPVITFLLTNWFLNGYPQKRITIKSFPTVFILDMRIWYFCRLPRKGVRVSMGAVHSLFNSIECKAFKSFFLRTEFVLSLKTYDMHLYFNLSLCPFKNNHEQYLLVDMLHYCRT